MTDTGDRAVSALYVNGHTRRWSMDLDRLPNQGQLDTAVPSHAVDLDAIQRAGIPRHIDAWLEDRYAEPRPVVVTHRPRRAWGWPEVATLLAIALVAVALILLLRQPIVQG